MKEDFNIQEYMTKGVENIVKGAVRATLSNPAETVFMAKFAAASRLASKRRMKAEEEGEHIPAFLIASITSGCNLHCAGCYARANHACSDNEQDNQLTAAEWKRIFGEAEEMGISFILLAGGEPLIRKDVLEAAGETGTILFPVFTNGTLIGDRYLELFASRRNLFPVISIEGGEEKTDGRRGTGVYNTVRRAMDEMRAQGILYGASVTMTKENLEEALSDSFIGQLEEGGCKAVFYIEYVPVTPDSAELAPGDAERSYMQERLSMIREAHPGMVFVSFPGDEKASGGCVAAGRGFFHINAHGGAEPCPFSPYSDVNIRSTSLREALKSRLFRMLQDGGTLMEDHAGGCVLFEKKDEVERILREQ